VNTGGEKNINEDFNLYYILKKYFLPSKHMSGEDDELHNLPEARQALHVHGKRK